MVKFGYRTEIHLNPGEISQWCKYIQGINCSIIPDGFGEEDFAFCFFEFRYNANEASPLDITEIVTTNQNDDSFFDVSYDKDNKSIEIRYRIYDSGVGYARTYAKVYANSSILLSPFTINVNY